MFLNVTHLNALALALADRWERRGEQVGDRSNAGSKDEGIGVEDAEAEGFELYLILE
jgi:hypothetical protein